MTARCSINYPWYCNHLFGCVGLNRKEYCVLNKQYRKDEYDALVPRIIEHMQRTGEWGEFFPIGTSPLPYNTTVAQDYFPIEEQVAHSLGWGWHDFEVAGGTAAPVAIPDDIARVDERICEQVLTCKVTHRPYRVTRQEFKFYRENGIPIPELCFQARHQRRLAKRNPRQLWQRTCAQCEAELLTSFAPYRPETILCEECYLRVVY